MKAGSAGSNPDGVTKPIECISQPLSTLLNDIGEAVFSLNTLVVGLDAVEKGHEKPDDLDISWNPKDRKVAARKSRKFVLEAILVRVCEAVRQYAVTMSKLPRMEETRRRWDSGTSNAEKVGDVFDRMLGQNFLVPATVLLVHWRNRIVHVGSTAKLLPDEKRLLQANENEIAEKYKGLSVDCLLCHFEEGRPTLKDVSSLIAMAINAARHVDGKLQATLDKADLDAWIDHYGLSPVLARVKAETAPGKLNSSLQRVFRAKAPLLLDSYVAHYVDLRE